MALKKNAIKQPSIFSLGNLKKEYLLFDDIYFDSEEYEANLGLFSQLNPNKDYNQTKLNKGIEELLKKGILKNFSLADEIKNYLKARQGNLSKEPNAYLRLAGNFALNYRFIAESFNHHLEKNNIQDAFYCFEERIKHQGIFTKIASIMINNNNGTNIIPLVDEHQDDISVKNDQIISVVFKKIPCPIAEVSWDVLSEIKTDSEYRNNILAFRNWINDLSKPNLDLNVVEDKVEYLLNEYEQHLQLCKIKYRLSKQEILYTIPFDLMILNLKELTKKIFSIRILKVNQEMEMKKLPGKELAFISQINKKIKKEYGF